MQPSTDPPPVSADGVTRLQSGGPDLPTLNEAGCAALFREARTARAFAPGGIPDATLSSIWKLAKWPPTATNSQPLRVTFVRTEEGKSRLLPLLAEANRHKSASAPVVAVLAADLDFHEFAPHTFPVRPELRDVLEASGRAGRAEIARFNATLQIGYFLLAVRAHGLAAGPMEGFDHEAATAEFYPGGRAAVLLLVNLGHPGPDAWKPRLPRLTEAQVVSWA